MFTEKVNSMVACYSHNTRDNFYLFMNIYHLCLLLKATILIGISFMIFN